MIVSTIAELYWALCGRHGPPSMIIGLALSVKILLLFPQMVMVLGVFIYMCVCLFACTHDSLKGNDNIFMKCFMWVG